MSFINASEVKLRKNKTACNTPEEVVARTRERIQQWAEVSDWGMQKKKLGTPNLLVPRTIGNRNAMVIKIPVANETPKVWEVDVNQTLKPQIEECLQSLDDIQEELFETYQAMCKKLSNARNRGES